MRYINTVDRKTFVGFREALFRGMTANGGLFLPERFIDVSEKLLDIVNLPFAEKAKEILFPYVEDIPKESFSEICNSAFNFPVNLRKFTSDLAVLELFSGPTLAFKDFGARFLAGLLSWYLTENKKKSVVLVATSGDTGSAVASAFYKKDNILVVLLYPSGMVSPSQEKQLTTFDGNIIALEIMGTFDDCQRMVKEAFSDNELRSSVVLTSANSINIGRLLPQSLYYFEAYSQCHRQHQKMNFIVPSGNLGNITSGIIAALMGLPVNHFIAALNENKVFLEYLNKGIFKPAHTKKTLSNAMDVGNPSNIHRLFQLFDEDLHEIKKRVSAFSINDDLTLKYIREFYDSYKYIIDPHTAVGYGAYLNNSSQNDEINIILSTAHYGKFIDVVGQVIEREYLRIPDELERQMQKEKRSVLLPADYSTLKDYLLSFK